MLTPQELLEIIDTMYPLLDDLNSWITADLIKRIMERLGRGEKLILTPTDEWQLQVYQAAGGHFESIQMEIARFTKQTESEVKMIFEGAGIVAFDRDNEFYVSRGLSSKLLAQSEDMIQILTDTYQRTNAEIRNFTRTTARASQKRLVNVLDTAHFKVMSGATSSPLMMAALKYLSAISAMRKSVCLCSGLPISASLIVSTRLSENSIRSPSPWKA